MGEQTFIRKIEVGSQDKITLPEDLADEYIYSRMNDPTINWYVDPDRDVLCLGNDKLTETDLVCKADGIVDKRRRVVIQKSKLPDRLSGKLRSADYIWGVPDEYDGHPIFWLCPGERLAWNKNSSKSSGHTDVEIIEQTTRSQAGIGSNNEQINTAERTDETAEASTSTESQTDAQESKSDSIFLTLPVQTSLTHSHGRGCCQEPRESPENDEDIVHYDPSEHEVPF